MPIEQRSRRPGIPVVLHRTVYPNTQSLEQWCILLASGKRCVRLWSIWYTQAERPSPPERRPDEIHGMYDLLCNVRRVLRAGTKIDGDIEWTRL